MLLQFIINFIKIVSTLTQAFCISAKPKIISRVIKKTTTKPKTESPIKDSWEEDEEEDLNTLGDLDIEEAPIDLDEYSEEDLDD